MANSTAERADIYARITAEIIAAVEAGVGTWRMPWHHDGASNARPLNVASRKGYRGVNVLALWASAQASDYASGLWGTYRQWQELGAQVRRGERSCQRRSKFPHLCRTKLPQVGGSGDQPTC